MGVALAGCYGDAGVEDGASFLGAGLFCQELCVHQVSGNVFDITLKEFTEVELGVGRVSQIGTLKSETIAGECVVGFSSNELFEQLAAGFLLFSHGRLRIIARVEGTPKFMDGPSEGR